MSYYNLTKENFKFFSDNLKMNEVVEEPVEEVVEEVIEENLTGGDKKMKYNVIDFDWDDIVLDDEDDIFLSSISKELQENNKQNIYVGNAACNPSRMLAAITYLKTGKNIVYIAENIYEAHLRLCKMGQAGVWLQVAGRLQRACGCLLAIPGQLLQSLHRQARCCGNWENIWRVHHQLHPYPSQTAQRGHTLPWREGHGQAFL